MTTTSAPAGAADQIHRDRFTVATAWAGILGPFLFTAVFLVLEVALGSRYSRVAEVVSALEATPYGWVQRLNFVVFGILTLAFAVGLHRAVRPSRLGVAGPALLGVSGVGLLLAAVFPLREDANGLTYDPGGHVVAGVMFFATSAIGLVMLSRRLAHDPGWCGLSRYVLTAGIAGVAGFVLIGALVMPDGAALNPYAGLFQRALILVVLFPCRIILGLHLLQAAPDSALRPPRSLSG
jgi:hypothetical membrane protein